MHEEKTEEHQIEARKEAIYNRINIIRSMVNKGSVAPKGYIYYVVKYKTFKDVKYEGVRMIDKEKENALGMPAIVLNIKKQIAIKHFDAKLFEGEAETI
jgi:hypothetical protein